MLSDGSIIFINALTLFLGLLTKVLDPYVPIILGVSISMLLGSFIGISVFWKYRKKNTPDRDQELPTIHDWNSNSTTCTETEISASTESAESVEYLSPKSLVFSQNSARGDKGIEETTEYSHIADSQNPALLRMGIEETTEYAHIADSQNPALLRTEIEETTEYSHIADSQNPALLRTGIEETTEYAHIADSQNPALLRTELEETTEYSHIADSQNLAEVSTGPEELTIYTSVTDSQNSARVYPGIEEPTDYVSIADSQNPTYKNDVEESVEYLSPKSILDSQNPYTGIRDSDATEYMPEVVDTTAFENDNSLKDYAKIQDPLRSSTCDDDTYDTDYARPISIDYYHSLTGRDVYNTNNSGYTGLQAPSVIQAEEHVTGSNV